MPLTASRIARAAILLSSTSFIALGAAGIDRAEAACTTTGPGTAAAPGSGATITCTGPLETTPTNAPAAANVTVNIARGSGYSTTATNAITLGAGTTVGLTAGRPGS